MLGGTGMKKLFLLKMLEWAGIRKTPFNLLGEADTKKLNLRKIPVGLV